MNNIYETISESVRNGDEAWVVTVIKTFGSTPSRTGAKMFLLNEERFEGTIGGGNLEQLVKKRILKEKPETLQIWDIDLESEAKMACGGRVTLIVEPLFPKDRLYIIGGGHVAVQLSQLAAKSGFKVTVIDNRPEWANRQKHPLAKTVVAPYDDFKRHIRFSENCYLVVMTHQHRFDMMAVSQLVNESYRYLGMIGSKNKVSKTAEKLKEAGVPDERINKIHAPIGLEIHSDTPFEIAVSIVAELIKVKNGQE